MKWMPVSKGMIDADSPICLDAHSLWSINICLPKCFALVDKAFEYSRGMRRMRRMKRRMRRRMNEDEVDEEDDEEDQRNEEDEEDQEDEGLADWPTGWLVKKGQGRIWAKSDAFVIALSKKTYRFWRRGWLAAWLVGWLACCNRLAGARLAASGRLAGRLASRSSFLSLVLANINILEDQHQTFEY